MDDKTSKLLKEYEIIQSTAQMAETPIWQTSAVIGLGSAGTLVAFVLNPEVQTVLASGMGIFINLVAFFWFKMARRWWNIQHVKFLRCRHIEKILGDIYTHHYISLRDKLRNKTARQKDSDWLCKTAFPEDWKESIKKATDWQNYGTQFFSQFFLAVNLASWIAYTIYLKIENSGQLITKISTGIFWLFAAIFMYYYCHRIVCQIHKNRVSRKKARGA